MAGDAGDAQATTGGEGGGEAAAGPDFGAMSQQLQAMQSGQEDLRSTLAAIQTNAPWMQEQEAEQEQIAAPDLSFLDDALLDPEEAQTRFAQVVNDAARQQAEALIGERMSPVEAKLSALEFNAQAAQLVEEFPEFGDEEVVKSVVDSTAKYVEQNYGDLPAEVQQRLKGSVAMYRTVFLMGRALEAHQAEGEGIPSLHMEGGGGAMPVGGQQDLGRQIVGARRGSSALPTF